MKKFLSLIVSATLAVSAITGCVKNGSDSTDLTSDYAKENAVATIGDYYITPEVLDFYIGQAISTVQEESGSEPGWEQIVLSGGLTARDEVINQALEYAKQDYSLIMEAKKLNVYSEKRNNEFIESYINYYLGGEDSFKEMLEMYGYNELAFNNSLTAISCYQSIIALECTEEEAATEFYNTYDNGDYYVAKHILFTFDGRDSEEDALKEANAAYERAVNGENFEELIDELGEDPGQTSEYGYMFTEGEMVEEFENTVKSLEIGEISEPVRTDYGYHVIKRYDIARKGDPSYDDYIHEMRVTIGSSRMTEEKLNALFDNYTIETDESKLAKIDLSKYTTESATE